ncbi:MAG: biotin--[acetyl-CoA-carboxylase] ligase [Treponema sp.]|jgi:BirA family biotin operon repressor/biotin-[acetyl-CoA-carboxylase] ligase|nr:biotin--[acetyl-CoA-carboxylase] ligase [Treponema sp.]
MPHHDLRRVHVDSPFDAPVLYRETVTSTMDEARKLSSKISPHGTVIIAGYQTQGRGRIRGRPWTASRGQNLSCTIILRYAPGEIPPAITLRTGLALALALEDFAPALSGRVRVKWPNDIMLDTKKAAGILTEAGGEVVYIGIGVNLAQTEFPPDYAAKATSLLLAGISEAAAPEARFKLLGYILLRLHAELGPDTGSWRGRLEARLYRLGGNVSFAPGAADSGELVRGRLAGIGEDGELLIVPEGEAGPRAFVTGELGRR